MELAYSGLISLVVFAIPILFIMGALDIINPQDDANWLGVITAIFAGMLYMGRPLVRKLIGVRPDAPTDKELEDYESATVIGTLIRIAALVFGFGCPMLFATANMGPRGIADPDLKIAAIICVFVCIFLTIAARTIEDFLYGPRQD